MADVVWTIGHSTRSLEDFLKLLAESGIEAVADVRRYPGSRRWPHFARGALAGALGQCGVAYLLAPRARRPAHTPGRFAEHGVAQRGLPWLCGLHGDRGLRRWSGPARQPGLRVTYGGDVRRVAVVAVSPRLDRRCASFGPNSTWSTSWGQGRRLRTPIRRRRGSSAGAWAMRPPDAEPCGSSGLAARERLATYR